MIFIGLIIIAVVLIFIGFTIEEHKENVKMLEQRSWETRMDLWNLQKSMDKTNRKLQAIESRSLDNKRCIRALEMRQEVQWTMELQTPTPKGETITKEN